MRAAILWLYVWGALLMWLNVGFVLADEPENCSTHEGICAAVAISWPISLPAGLAMALLEGPAP